MRNDPRLILDGGGDNAYGLRGRIRRAVARDQEWKVLKLNWWRFMFQMQEYK